MAEQSELKPAHSRDVDAMVEQTQPAALKLLDDAALNALLRDLRAMKAEAKDGAMQKALAQAIQRAAADKRQRQPAGAAAGAAAAPAPVAAKPGKAEKAREKIRKEAERAERKRLKETERAERKTARQAEKAEAKAGKLAARPATAKAEGKPKPGKNAGVKADKPKADKADRPGKAKTA